MMRQFIAGFISGVLLILFGWLLKVWLPAAGKIVDVYLYRTVGNNYWNGNMSVLALVLTQPANLKTSATTINRTWGSRFDKLLFVSDSYDPDLPTLNLSFPAGRGSLAKKNMDALDYVYQNYGDTYDWFMTTDDDTFVIAENLRYFLRDKNPHVPVYFGQIFKMHVKQGYPQGGAGFVLSREALKRFGQRSDGYCPLVQNEGDLEVGRCLEKVGVPIKDTVDTDGRTRFHVFRPVVHLKGDFPNWYPHQDIHRGTKKSLVSDYAVTFHHMTAQDMIELDYYLYHLRVDH